MASISLKHIYKVYDGNVRAVNDFNLDVEDKEFIVFVGPSGCGKSTTLRMIAGLESITSGELYIGDKLVNDVEPKNRDITMVFQNYALYPHMTVYENMAFGLKQAHTPKNIIDQKVKSAAEILGLTELLNRKPKQLSGGQRQRVALGRSIVREPKVFLLDEPLSNLDAKLRVQMRSEISKLHERLQTTFIYVTHDQTEAMTMGTKIVVMQKGIIQQVDTPKTLYDYPANTFVATFLGSPQMNLFDVNLQKEEDKCYAVFKSQDKMELLEHNVKQIIYDKYFNEPVILGIRPEDIVESTKDDANFKLKVNVVELLGTQTIVYGKVDGIENEIIASLNPRSNIHVGDELYLKINNEHIHLFDSTTQKRIINIPEFNCVKSELKINGLDHFLIMGDKEIKLDDQIYYSIMPSYRKDLNVEFKFEPKKIMLERKNDSDIEFDVKIDFIEEMPSMKVIYGYDTCSDKIIAVPMNKMDKEYKKGDVIKAFVSIDDIILYNDDNRITCKYPLYDYSFDIIKTDEAGFAHIKLFGKEVTTSLKPNNENQKVILPFEAVSLKKGKNTISIRGINEDKVLKQNIMYAKTDGFDGYLSLFVDDKISIFGKSKYKASLDLTRAYLK